VSYRIASTFATLSTMLALTLTVAGCGSVSGSSLTPTPTPVSSPSPTPTPGISPTPTPTPVPSAQIIYQVSFLCTTGNPHCSNNGVSSDGVYAYRMDPSTGAVTDIPGSPFFTGSNAQNVIATPSGNLVFAADVTTDAGHQPIIEVGSNDFVTFRPDPITGVLTKLATTALPGRPFEVVMHPSGKFLYAIARDLVGFAIDQNSGKLTALPSIPLGFDNDVSDFSLNIDPAGRFIYAMINGRISVFRIDANNGALTAVPGSPFSLGSLLLTRISVHPSGRFIYVSGDPQIGSGSIFELAVDQNTGALTPISGSPLVVKTPVVSMTFVNNGLTAYADGDKELNLFSVNTSTGELTALSPVAASGFTFGNNVVDGTGQFVYVGSTGILGFRVQGDGTPQSLPGFPHGTALGIEPHGIAIAPLP